jgi:hypothetical protein
LGWIPEDFGNRPRNPFSLLVLCVPCDVCAFGQFCEVWRFLGGSLLLLKRWLQSEAFDPRKVDKGRAFHCQQWSQGQLTQHVCVQIKAPKVLVEFQAASIQFYHVKEPSGTLVAKDLG